MPAFNLQAAFLLGLLHFVTADPPTFHFDTYKLSDQTLATTLARDFQLLFQVRFSAKTFGITPRTPMAPEKRVNPLVAHAANFGLSASGSQRSSQITESGSFRA
jgi:hypothetical protein